MKGRVQKRRFNDEELEFRIKTINLLSSVKDELIKTVTLKVKTENVNKQFISELTEFIKENPGETELRFIFYDSDDKISLPMFSRNIRVRLNNELINFLDDHPSIEYKVN